MKIFKWLLLLVSLPLFVACFKDNTLEECMLLLKISGIYTDGIAGLEGIGIGLIESLLVHISGIEFQGSLAYAVYGEINLSVGQLV